MEHLLYKYFQPIDTWLDVTVYIVLAVVSAFKFMVRQKVKDWIIFRIVNWLGTIALTTLILACLVKIFSIPIYARPWIFIPRNGVDESGRHAEFEVIILTQEFRWRYADANIVEFDGVPQNIEPYLRSLKNRVVKMDDLICVGTASYEGERGGEEIRASARADRLITWINKMLSPERSMPNLWKLNLGKFISASKSRGLTPEQTSEQRKVILIGVRNKDDNTDLRQALKDALMKESEPMLFDIKDYSKSVEFPLSPFRLQSQSS